MRFIIFVLAALVYSPQGIAQRLIGETTDLERVGGSLNPARIKEGYVLGIISRVASEGVLVDTLEGEIKLGMRSTRGGVLDEDCYRKIIKKNNLEYDEKNINEEFAIQCTELINPWHFSHQDETLVKTLSDIGQSAVLVFFRTYKVVPFVVSPNYIVKVYPVDPDLPLDANSMEANLFLSDKVHYSSGFYDGRIVMASNDGVVRKANEVIIQVGTSGDIFRKVSVSSRKLFDYIIQVMATAKMVRVHYYQMFSPLGIPVNLVAGYDTLRRVYKVEVLDEPAP